MQLVCERANEAVSAPDDLLVGACSTAFPTRAAVVTQRTIEQEWQSHRSKTISAPSTASSTRDEPLRRIRTALEILALAGGASHVQARVVLVRRRGALQRSATLPG